MADENVFQQDGIFFKKKYIQISTGEKVTPTGFYAQGSGIVDVALLNEQNEETGTVRLEVQTSGLELIEEG